MKQSGEGRRRKTLMLSIRTVEELKSNLERAATVTGRSLTQEIESRLERSLVGDEFVGGVRTAAFLNTIGAAIREIEIQTGCSWHTDHDAWLAVSKLIKARLSALEPAKAEMHSDAKEPKRTTKSEKVVIRRGPKARRAASSHKA